MKKHLTNINILHTSFKTRSVIDFNHIDKSLKKQWNNIIIQILNLKASVGKKSPHDVQKTKSVMQFVIVLLIVSGTIAGRVSTNPFVLGILPGSGLILKTFWEMKDFKKKIELCQFAFTTYVTILIDLRSFLRGV